MSTSTVRTKVIYAGIALALAGIAGYAVFALRGYLFGPSLTVSFPTDGATVPAGLIVIQGKTERIKVLTINEKQVSVQQDGSFSFPLVVFAPYTILDVSGTDTFGKQKKVKIELNVN